MGSAREVIFNHGKAEGRVEGEAKGKAKGEAEGEARGKAEGEARALLKILRQRGSRSMPSPSFESSRRASSISSIDGSSAR